MSTISGTIEEHIDNEGEVMATHVVIPDSQVKPGTPTDHLKWIGQYIVDKFAGVEGVKVIHLGDFADFESLSSYDTKGGTAMEHRRIKADFDAANRAFDILNGPLEDYNAKRRANKQKQWLPEKHMLLGNHCNRVSRAVEQDAALEGFLTLDDLNFADHGWQVHPFLEPVMLDGVAYAHYFYHPNTGRAYSGNVETRLRQIGTSFTQGHQQGLQVGQRSVFGKRQRGLVAGSAYLHTEDYRGPQGRDEWRGIIICHDVRDGDYDLMEVSLSYLCRRYEDMELVDFMAKHHPEV